MKKIIGGIIIILFAYFSFALYTKAVEYKPYQPQVENPKEIQTIYSVWPSESKEIYSGIETLSQTNSNMVYIPRHIESTNEFSNSNNRMVDQGTMILSDLFLIGDGFFDLIEYCIFLNLLIFAVINTVFKLKCECVLSDLKLNTKEIFIRIMKLIASISIIMLFHYVYKTLNVDTVFFVIVFLLVTLILLSFMGLYDNWMQDINKRKCDEINCHCIVCDIEIIAGRSDMKDHIRLLVRDINTSIFLIIACPISNQFKRNEYLYFCNLKKSDFDGVDYEITDMNKIRRAI